MRWIFFVLVGVNLLLLGWQWLTPNDSVGASQPAPRVTPRPAGVPSIVLLKESMGSDSVDLPSNPRSSGIAGEKSTESDPIDSLCTFVGPFEAVAQAEQLVERLAAMAIPGHVAQVEIPAGPGYWIYMGPLDSRREALRRLAELQAQGVDSYVIPRGDLENGISLGMFSKKPLAHARIKGMAELGIEAKLEIIERSYNETWVSIPAAAATKLGNQAWQRLLESEKNAQRRQNFCLPVASQDNIH